MPLSLSPLPQGPWSVSVRNAYQKLFQIYQTTSSYVDSGSVEAHRLEQYRQMIIVEAHPLLLLLAESAESESLPLYWIENIATEFTMLLALVDECWTSAKEEYAAHLMAGINLKFMFLDWLPILQFCNLFILCARENVVDPEKMLIPKFSMMLFRKTDGFLQQFLQAFLASIERLSKHVKMNWV